MWIVYNFLVLEENNSFYFVYNSFLSIFTYSFFCRFFALLFFILFEFFPLFVGKCLLFCEIKVKTFVNFFTFCWFCFVFSLLNFLQFPFSSISSFVHFVYYFSSILYFCENLLIDIIRREIFIFDYIFYWLFYLVFAVVFAIFIINFFLF